MKDNEKVVKIDDVEVIVGDPDSMYAGYCACKGLLYKRIMAICPGARDIDDKMQDAYIVYDRCLRQYDSTRGASFATYLARAFDNCLINGAQNKANVLMDEADSIDRPMDDDADDAAKLGDCIPDRAAVDPYDVVAEREVMQACKALIDRMPAAQKRAVERSLAGYADSGNRAALLRRDAAKYAVRRIGAMMGPDRMTLGELIDLPWARTDITPTTIARIM